VNIPAEAGLARPQTGRRSPRTSERGRSSRRGRMPRSTSRR
jgi:hypothetical protein